ncbi:MAG: hypothetical protein ACI8RD_004863 [Bacillariaceae sp.]|jgi:hypothetical protein
MQYVTHTRCGVIMRKCDPWNMEHAHSMLQTEVD